MSKRRHHALSQFRKDRNLTVDEAAAMLGVNRATMLRWEVGDPEIPVKRLEDVERITGIPRQQLRPDLFAGLS